MRTNCPIVCAPKITYQLFLTFQKYEFVPTINAGCMVFSKCEYLPYYIKIMSIFATLKIHIL